LTAGPAAGKVEGRNLRTVAPGTVVMRRCLALGLVLAAAPAPAGEAPAPAPARPNEAARAWFQDAKFGLSLHWGVFSLLGKGEWVMDRDKIPPAEYEKLPPRFNPTRFDAEGWVRAARAAGARYLTVTAKHHDGFCLFDSKLTRYDVVDATPYGRDPLRSLADACHKEGIKLFFYYSLLDWHHPDYPPQEEAGKAAGRPDRGDWKAYVAYYQGQLRELCTNYGEVGGIWLDGHWDRKDADWDLPGTYQLIHDLQPGALVGNNHHLAPLPGEDFQVFEQDLPGEDTAGFNKAPVAEGMPLETCLTLNRSWGHAAADKEFKEPDQVIHALLGAAGRGANLLLIVGPKADGSIPAEATGRLGEIGRWLGAHGEYVYGTRRGPIPPQPWGVSTRIGPGDRRTGGVPEVQLHIMKGGPVLLPGIFGAYEARRGGAVLKLIRQDRGFVVELPDVTPRPVDTIVVLKPTGFGR